MRKATWQAGLTLLSVLLVAIVLAGCPKKPSSTAGAGTGAEGTTGGTGAGGPGAGEGGVGSAPSGQVGEGAGGRGSGSVASTGPGGVPGAQISPKEFLESRALKEIHFDYDKYDISPQAGKLLEENAKWLKSNAKTLLLIEGHADERGTSEYNLALGERRAKATRDYLVSLGIEGGRVSTISYGKERPFCNEHAEGCWAQNRRAHFLTKP